MKPTTTAVHKLMIDWQEYFLVGVPKDAYDIQLWNHGVGFKHDNYAGETDTNGFYHIHTGLGRWRKCKLIGGVASLSEQQYTDLVYFMPFDDGTVYQDYSDKEFIQFRKITAKQSFISRLKSKNILAQSFIDRPKLTGEAAEAITFYNLELEEYNNLPEELLLIQKT